MGLIPYTLGIKKNNASFIFHEIKQNLKNSQKFVPRK